MGSGSTVQLRCDACGAQFSSLIHQAAATFNCSACNSSALTIAAPIAAETGFPAVAGTSLSQWRDYFFASKKPNLAPIVAPPPASLPNPTGGPPHVHPAANLKLPPKGRNSKGRNQFQPQTQKGSKLHWPLVIGSVAAVVFATAVFVVTMTQLKRENLPTQQQNVAPSTVARTSSNAANQPLPASENRDLALRTSQLSKAFGVDCSGHLATLDRNLSELEQANTSLRSVLEKRAGDLKATVEKLEKEEAVLNEKFSACRNTESMVKKEVDGAQAKLDLLRASQSPLSAYLGAYEEYSTAIAANNDTLVELGNCDNKVQDALTASSDQRTKVTDLVIAVNTSEDGEERTAAQLALDRARSELDKKNKALDDAKDARSLAFQKALQSAENLDRILNTISDLRTKLDPKDPETAKLLLAISKYEELLLAKAKAAKSVKAAQSELDSCNTVLANLLDDGQYVDAKTVYLNAHRAALQKTSARKVLEQRYLNDEIRGESAKEAIRRAKAEEDAAKATEAKERDAYNLVLKSIKEAKSKVQTADSNLRAAQKQFADAAGKLAPGRKDLSAAVAIALKAIGPEEQARLKDSENALKKLGEASEALEKAKSQSTRVENELNRATQSRVSAERSLAEANKCLKALAITNSAKAIRETIGEFRIASESLLNVERASALQAYARDRCMILEDDTLAINDDELDSFVSSRYEAIQDAASTIRVLEELAEALAHDLQQGR